MTHEATAILLDSSHSSRNPLQPEIGPCRSYFVILSSMLRGSRMNVGKTTLLRSAPGLSWDMICDRTEAVVVSWVAPWWASWEQQTIALVGLDDQGIIFNRLALRCLARGSAAYTEAHHGLADSCSGHANFHALASQCMTADDLDRSMYYMLSCSKRAQPGKFPRRRLTSIRRCPTTAWNKSHHAELRRSCDSDYGGDESEKESFGSRRTSSRAAYVERTSRSRQE